MARFHWCFFAIGALLIISISGETNNENSDVVVNFVKGKCPENEICETETSNVEVGCKETDENGNCKDTVCGEGQGLDPATGECREVTTCEDGPCEEKMQKMQESPGKERRLKGVRAKKGLHIALILKKKHHMMKPFLKPKPKPPPPHHGHHHHHHSSEEEEEEEEDPEPDPDDAPDGAPEIRLFNDEICVGGEDGTTGNCNNSTVAPETATAKPRRPRQEPQPDPAEANTVRKRVIRFLKVLRMRRRLNPVFGRIRKRNAPKVSPAEKMRK